MPDSDFYRRSKSFAKQTYEKQMVAAASGAGGANLDRIGAPHWSREAWEAFRNAYGRYPSFREGDIPNLSGAPPWVFELMNMKPPPVDVTTGSAGATYPGVNDLTVWKMK